MARSRSPKRAAITAAKQRLLILCYGNIYRSPFVEHYLRSRLAGTDKDIEIKSAGFHHKENRESPEDYQSIVANSGVDLSPHRSVVVNQALLDWADKVIIMEGMQYKSTLLMDASLSDKLIWLGAFDSNNPVEIPDPYGKSQSEVVAIVDRMKNACDNLASGFMAIGSK